MAMGEPKPSWGIYLIIALCLSAACLFAVRHLTSRSPETPETGTVLKWTALDTTATVEIANTAETRRQGLMFRNSLADDHGMYFIYPVNHRTAFWMRNTTIPLSIAFIREDGVIVDIKDMAPLDETPVGPNVDYRDALEMKQGWFRQNGITIDDRTELKGGRVSFWRRSL